MSNSPDRVFDPGDSIIPDTTWLKSSRSDRIRIHNTAFGSQKRFSAFGLRQYRQLSVFILRPRIKTVLLYSVNIRSRQDCQVESTELPG